MVTVYDVNTCLGVVISYQAEKRGEVMNKKSRSIMTNTVIAITTLMLSSSPAYAYLDPGTGSAILQGIIGAIAAIAIVLKLYWHRFLRILGVRKGTQTSKQESSDKTNSGDSR